MTLPKLHDQLILGSDLPEDEQITVEVVAVDHEQQAVTVYDADEDRLDLVILKGTRFSRVAFVPTKEPWES